jgi:hypothetical protein
MSRLKKFLLICNTGGGVLWSGSDHHICWQSMVVPLCIASFFWGEGGHARGLREYRNRLNFIPESNLEYIKIIGCDYIS